MAKETVTNKFVRDMLESAEKRDATTPQTRSEGIIPTEIEKITQNIRERLQKKK